tara:strand:- start:62 stop:283 length:222 start_codon:yes stop_codon:yes gene_type:complete
MDHLQLLLVVAEVRKIMIHQIVELVETVELVVEDKVEALMVVQDLQQQVQLILVVAEVVKRIILYQLEQVVVE